MWRNRNIWILLSGEAIANVGLWVGIIGNLEFLSMHVPSDFAKSLILFVGLFFGVLFGPLAGKMIDQYSIKSILFWSSFIRMITVLFMFVAISQQQVLWMMVYMLGIGVSAAFYFPALQALIPRIVAEKDLLTVNGVHMNVGTIARIIGTAIGGVMVVSLSLNMTYTVVFVSYLFLLSCIPFLRLLDDKKRETRGKKNSKGTGFKEVLPLLKEHPRVYQTLLLTLVPISFIGSFNLMVLKISEIQQNPAIKGWLYTCEGIAFMVGAFLAKRFSQGKDKLGFITVSAIFIAASQLLLFFADSFIMSVMAFSLFGISAGAFFPVAATIFQTEVPKEIHGRFFSFRGMMDRVLFQVVLVFTGFLLDAIGFFYMIIIFGTISMVLALMMTVKYFKNKSSEVSSKDNSVHVG